MKKSQESVREYRGLIIEDGLRHTANALAVQIGADPMPAKAHEVSAQFAFEAAIARQVTRIDAYYFALLEAAPDAIVVVGRDGQIVFANAQAARQFGFEPGELLEHKVTDLIPEGLLEQPSADDAGGGVAASLEQVAGRLERTGRRKTGSLFPAEITLSAIKTRDAELVMAAIRNISVRKSTEKHLARMEARYRGLLDAAPDALIVVNRRGKILVINGRTEAEFGYSRAELLGQTVTRIIPEGLAERLIPEDAKTVPEALAPYSGTGLVLTAIHKDGSEFAMEIMLNPMVGPQGTLIIATLRRVEDSGPVPRTVQAAWRQGDLLEAMPDAMIIIDATGEIVRVNAEAERKFGTSRDRLVGQDITGIVPEGLKERLAVDELNSAEMAMVRNLGSSTELVGRREDGSTFPIEVTLGHFGGGGGRLAVAAIRDISIRRAAETAIHQA